MEFVIISGLSGAGKSKAASFMEDMDFFCVDNLPAPLIPKFAELGMAGSGEYDRVVLVTDIRGGTNFGSLFQALQDLTDMQCEYHILFMEAATEVIIKRYKETRRSHPLAEECDSLEQAIELERKMLAPLRERADYVIDTSNLSTAKLKGELRRLFAKSGSAQGRMDVRVSSFGFKYGIPMEADLVFDVRFLPNPYYVAELRPISRMSLKDICDAFVSGAKSTVSVAIACACVGIIVGVCGMTGFALNVAHAIIRIGQESVLLTLVFTMITCMILGMGLPSIPSYLITATIAAPALVELGQPELAAHLFCFYFAMFANLTPPVALASFAAAGLSGGSPMKTGWQSVRLALAGFIIPYMFMYNPQLLLENVTWLSGTQVVISSCIGVVMIAAAVEGHLFGNLNWLLRFASMAGALMLIDSKTLTDIGGIAILAIIIAYQKLIYQPRHKDPVSPSAA